MEQEPRGSFRAPVEGTSSTHHPGRDGQTTSHQMVGKGEATRGRGAAAIWAGAVSPLSRISFRSRRRFRKVINGPRKWQTYGRR